MLVPSREEFLKAAAGSRMPVYRDVLADMETPLGAYWRLAHDETYSFILESVTGGEQLARYSILGVRPHAVLRSRGRNLRRITKDGTTESKIDEGQDPLHALKAALDRETVPVEGLPKFVGGAVGMLGYDLVRYFERLPEVATDDLGVDEMAMMLCDSVVVFDHAKNVIRVVVLAEGTPEGYDKATVEIERVLQRLRGPLPALPSVQGTPQPVESNTTRRAYEDGVERIRQYIAAGDGIQMVLSQRFSTSCQADPLSVYRALRSLNPSPYMYMFRFGDCDIIGASPELLVSLQGRTARVRPIAGTRKRGTSEEGDRQLEAELLADEKERAEHIMLVDLGRNDLGRVCEYGSVNVDELMTVERYSHVMHIVSDVTGTLRPDLDGFDLMRATFPAGTVSGAPKVRAMEIIEELEPTRRGCYAGAVGYVSAYGDLDLAITIRTIFLRDGVAYVQAGAGIVYDSIPAKEFEECMNKAQAALKAIEIAQLGLDGVP
ncbi:MAG TPA: anthranilate synthase component I [Fimbriimonadaceae bacterium]|nr:anthranilate synthase component I [Fimbriimonadaceae bacterium]HRJ96529.1 anthranilate synthase component I [Fimbriimonadaceae bacterium]